MLAKKVKLLLHTAGCFAFNEGCQVVGCEAIASCWDLYFQYALAAG